MQTVDDYFARCADRQLAVQQCSDCRQYRFPLSPVCPRCLGREFTWDAVAGGGTVWSWITFHQRYFPAEEFDLPYDVALIELDEGPMMISGFAAGAERPATGDRVEVVFEPNKPGGRTLPRFKKMSA